MNKAYIIKKKLALAKPKKCNSNKSAILSKYSDNFFTIFYKEQFDLAEQNTHHKNNGVLFKTA